MGNTETQPQQIITPSVHFKLFVRLIFFLTFYFLRMRITRMLPALFNTLAFRVPFSFYIGQNY